MAIIAIPDDEVIASGIGEPSPPEYFAVHPRVGGGWVVILFLPNGKALKFECDMRVQIEGTKHRALRYAAGLLKIYRESGGVFSPRRASPLPTPPKRSEDLFRQRLHDIVFSRLPRSTSKEAQASHRLADAIAADLVGEMARGASVNEGRAA